MFPGVDHSPPGEYGQNIPSREVQGGPPILPPHLLQVILNKELSVQVLLLPGLLLEYCQQNCSENNSCFTVRTHNAS